MKRSFILSLGLGLLLAGFSVPPAAHAQNALYNAAGNSGTPSSSGTQQTEKKGFFTNLFNKSDSTTNVQPLYLNQGSAATSGTATSNANYQGQPYNPNKANYRLVTPSDGLTSEQMTAYLDAQAAAQHNKFMNEYNQAIAAKIASNQQQAAAAQGIGNYTQNQQGQVNQRYQYTGAAANKAPATPPRVFLSP